MRTKSRRPTEAQLRTLRRIANAGGSMMLTLDNENERQHYSDQAGRTIPEPTARILIRNGWVIAERDGMFDTPQSWRVRGAL